MKTEDNNEEDHIIFYGDPRIASKDAPVELWLKLTYIILPIWGIISFWYFFNGTHGWLDRGYWNQLQKAALTTFPTKTIEELGEPVQQVEGSQMKERGGSQKSESRIQK